MTRSLDALKGAYKRLPAGVRAAVPSAAELWLRRSVVARLGPDGRVRTLEDKLLGGFSIPARAELEALIAGAATPPARASEAALVLARWHAAQGDFSAALARIVDMRRLRPRSARAPQQFMLEALFLCRLGRLAEARALLDARTRGFHASAHLMRANTWNPAAGAGAPDAPDRMLAAINAVFLRSGLAPLVWRDPARPPSLDNLATAALPPHAGPRVSVIVPLWNAAATLATALASLAAQTHADLEVLVVDDASTDGGAAVAADFARRDPRFRLIRQSVNAGAYAARNRGLAQATGEFVTVHDADDWAHPEKIARHLDHLRTRRAPFNISDWVRATDDLCFWGPWRPSPDQLTRNFASVFFRRDLIDRVGLWDTARVSADREFINRLQTLWRLPRQQAFLTGCPLAFGRTGDGSLTRAGPTHAATMYHGLRREYHEAGDLWHAGLDARAVRAAGIGVAPPYFPAPFSIRSRRETAPHDALFIGDFNFRGGAQKSALNMIAAARGAGLDAALLQYRRYDQNMTAPLNPEVRRMTAARGVRIVAPGEALCARTVVVTYPPILGQPMDRFPTVEHDHLVVVVNQMAERDREGADVAYDPARVRAHLSGLLGNEGLWAPISERVRTLMTADPRYPAPLAGNWTPLIDTDLWCARAPVWRGGTRTRPVIGRHGRDHPLKWPADPAALRAAYCADRPCEVRFLGGALHARLRARPWPANWREAPFDAHDVRAFLADLDVFMHYPDPSYIEEFGRAPMEAMAVGVPVILPPEFEPTFGAAALYAAPDDVWPAVAHLTDDRAAWEARVAAGRAFVHANCGHAAFPRRLAALGAG